MKKTMMCMAAATLLAGSAAATAQQGAVTQQGMAPQGAMAPQAAMASPGPAGEVLNSYNRVKANILKSADLMPADGYQYKPLPDIRTYARIVNHVIEAQTRSCGVANGTAPAAMAKTPGDMATKAEIVAALQASFAACDAAYAGVNAGNMTDMLTAGPAKRSRLGLLWGNVSHDMEQYAQLALYLRMKGLMPPSQEK